MIEMFSNSSSKTYKTERFCTFADHNIVLSVETRSDGNEQRVCQDMNVCEKKGKCRYLVKPQ